MFDIHRVELDWGGRKLTLETGKVARQADGAVLATYGETTVIATVVAAKQPKPGVDFLLRNTMRPAASPAATSSASAARPRRTR
jgi:ribonuclease PH